MKTILVYSGGMDSTTLLYSLLHTKNTVECISFDYGQRHKKELISARKICASLKVPHKIVDIKNVNALMQGSSLTSKKIAVPEGHYEDKSMRSTVVPNRNMVFLSLAIAFAVSRNFDRVAIAVHAGDHAIYPDCRPKFISLMDSVSRAANYKPIKIYAPFLHKSKKEIAVIGKKLGVPFEKTWTCYKGGHTPCGKCGACVEREEALGAIAATQSSSK